MKRTTSLTIAALLLASLAGLLWRRHQSFCVSQFYPSTRPESQAWRRLIGDMSLPPEKRFTQGAKMEQDAPLAESGLLGPVRIVTGERIGMRFNK